MRRPDDTADVADPVRFAVLGAGAFGGAMIDRINAAPGCQVAAIASRDADRAERIAREHGLPAGSGCSNESLLTCGDVEAVYIALPHHLHVPWAVRCLEAGKHVLCEKPLAWSRAEAARAFDAAERAGRVLAEGFMYMHHPRSLFMRGFAERALSPAGDELIGELVGVRAYREWALDRDGVAWTRFRRDMRGAALMDLGVYALSWPRWVSGRGLEGLRLESFETIPSSGSGGGAVDASCSWSGRLAGGGVWVEGACSMVERGRQTAALVGTKGTLSTGWAWSPDEGDGVFLFEPAAGGEGVSVNGPGAAGEGSGGDGAGRVGRAEAQFAAFARAVRGVGEALPSRSFSEAHAGSVESLLRSMGLGFGDESGSA